MKKLILTLILMFSILPFVAAGTFNFVGYVRDTDMSTAVAGANVTIKDPFNPSVGGPWSALTNSQGFFNISGVNDTNQATYMVIIVNNYTSTANIKVGPMVPPMPAQAFTTTGMPGPGGVNLSLNNLNWTLREGALINVTVYNTTQDISFGGEIIDKKIDWPLAGWYDQSSYTLNGLVYVPKNRNYTATIWSEQSPPRGNFISIENISDGYHQLRINSSTIMVNISGNLINASAVGFTRIRAYWLQGGDTSYYDSQSSLDGVWANKNVNATTGAYWHEVPSNTELMICGYANSSTVYYGVCSNVTVGVSEVNLNLTLAPLAGIYDTAAEPNTSKVTFNLYKRYNNGTTNVNELMQGRNYIKVKVVYGGRTIWWGLETNSSGSVKFPIQNNSNISVKVFANDAPPRELNYYNVIQSEINVTIEAMDQMADANGNELDALVPAFYASNSTCDLPSAGAGCQLFSFTNASAFNPFQLFALGGNISARMTLPSGVILHFKNVDLLAGEPDVHKPTQSANTTAGGTVAEAWKFGSMIPREMYESVLVGVPYNASLISEDHDFKLLITELYNINYDGTWVRIWNSTGDSNGVSVPSEYQDFSEYGNGLFNASRGGITCSKTDPSASCYVDTANDRVWFEIDHFSAVGPQVQTYAELGNITADDTVYSCWQDSASTQGCSALVNLTVDSASPLKNQIFNVSVNNTATVSGILYKIDWYNGSTWVNQTNNNTLLTNYNLTPTTHQFRINITLPNSVSTKWNISFGINGTNYVLDPWLDSINLTSPATNNITTDQTPDFGFVLYSNNWTTQSCSLYLNSTSYGTNSSVTNGSSTTITANTTLSEGNYSWYIGCNVTGSSATRYVFVNDTAAPTVTASVSSITSSGASLSVSTSETVSSCSYSGAGSGSLSGSGTSWSASLGSLSASTSYTVTVTCTDLGGNSGSGSDSFTTSSTGGGGAGGSAGGISTGVEGQFEKKVWTSILKGETAVVEVKKDAMATTKVEFKVTETAYGAWVQVKKVEKSDLSSDTKSFANKAYQYIEITKNSASLKDSIISDGKVYFRVENSWLKSNGGKDNLGLFRYNSGAWNELKTSVEKEDSTYTYYVAETPGFSYFVIGQKSAVAVAPIKAAEPVPETAAPAPSEPAAAPAPSAPVALAKAAVKAATKSPMWIWIVAVLVVIVIIGAVYWSFRKK